MPFFDTRIRLLWSANANSALEPDAPLPVRSLSESLPTFSETILPGSHPDAVYEKTPDKVLDKEKASPKKASPKKASPTQKISIPIPQKEIVNEVKAIYITWWMCRNVNFVIFVVLSETSRCSWRWLLFASRKETVWNWFVRGRGQNAASWDATGWWNQGWASSPRYARHWFYQNESLVGDPLEKRKAYREWRIWVRGIVWMHTAAFLIIYAHTSAIIFCFGCGV